MITIEGFEGQDSTETNVDEFAEGLTSEETERIVELLEETGREEDGRTAAKIRENLKPSGKTTPESGHALDVEDFDARVWSLGG